MIGSGTWRARAIHAALGRSGGEAKSPRVEVQLQAVEGLFEGDTITWYGYFSEKTFDRTVESLRILGWQGEDLSELSTVRGEADIVVAEKEWKGKITYEVRWINRPGSGDGGRFEGAAAKALAEQLRERVRAADKALAEKPPF